MGISVLPEGCMGRPVPSPNARQSTFFVALAEAYGHSKRRLCDRFSRSLQPSASRSDHLTDLE